MKYINLFDEFLNEEVKHINNDVIHYTSDLIKLIQTHDLSKDKLDIVTDLISREGLKLSNLKINININPINFNNYGSFKINKPAIIIDNCLTNCILYLELLLNKSEIDNNIISPLNKIYSLINHELNHALELYQYEFNEKLYRTSWEISKKYSKHKIFADQYKYWEDFIYLIYLGLDHEMNSRISGLYEDIKNYENPNEDIKNNKTYQNIELMSKFNFDIFYKHLIEEYDENTFLIICTEFCKDFDYKFINDIEYCKGIIKKIIISLNKKGDKMIRKIKNVIKRVEMERKGTSFFNEPVPEKTIDYTKYTKK